jgi:hypothetical protein
MPAIPAIIISAGTIYAAHEASKGNTEAAKTNAAASDTSAQIQADTANKALAQAKDIYQQQRADEGPYVRSGYGGLNALNYGLGLPSQEYQPPAAATPTPTNLPSSTINGLTFPGSPQVPQSTLSQLGQQANAGGVTGPVWSQVNDKVQQAQQLANTKYAGTGSTTKVQAPNGLVYLVPADKVAEAQQAGGKVV